MSIVYNGRMSLARKILENTFVQVFGKVVTSALSIVVLKLISGYLGPAGYGDYTTVYQFLAFFGIIADFGIYTITVKEMSRDEKRIPWILSNVLGLRAALCVGAMLLAVAVAALLPAYRGTVVPWGVVIATLATFFTILNGTVSSVLQVHLKMHYATVGLIVGKIASVLYIWWAVASDAGFNHLIASGVLGNLVMFLMTGYYVRRYTAVGMAFDFVFWKHLFFTSLPYGVALALNTIYFRIDVILLGFLLPHTTTLADGTATCAGALCGDTEVGLLGVAMRMLEMLVLIPVYFMNAVLPVMTRYIEEQSQKVRQLMQYSFDFLTASALPILVGGYLLAVPIIDFISDPEFISGNRFTYGSDVAVKILMFAMLFSFVNSLFGFTLVVLNKQTKLMMVNAACVGLNVLGNLALIPRMGFRGAAFVSVFSECFILVCTYMIAQKALGFHLSLRTFLRTVLSAGVMGLAVYSALAYFPPHAYLAQLAVLVPLGGLVYAGMMLATRAITSEMWALLRRRS